MRMAHPLGVRVPGLCHFRTGDPHRTVRSSTSGSDRERGTVMTGFES